MRGKLAAAGLLLAVLAACGPSLLPPGISGALGFEVIEQKNDGAYLGQQQYNALEPGLLVITNPEEAETGGLWFGGQVRSRLRGVNYARYVVVVAVFQGWKPTGGYGVEVDRVTLEAGVVRLFARFEEPGPDTLPPMTVTSPYALLAVEKTAGWPAGATFELVVGGAVVAHSPTPEP